MTFDEALAGAGDPELHPSIRSKYVDLLIGNACHTSMLQYWVLGINSEKDKLYPINPLYLNVCCSFVCGCGQQPLCSGDPGSFICEMMHTY